MIGEDSISVRRIIAQLPHARQVGFFNKMVITKSGIKKAFVLAFIHVKSRRIVCSTATLKPSQNWMTTQAKAMLRQASAAGLPTGYLIRDRDNCYASGLDSVFEETDIRVIPTAPRAPNHNAFVERWIGSLKHECLNRFITFGIDHLDYLVAEYVEFNNEVRPHQRKEIAR